MQKCSILDMRSELQTHKAVATSRRVNSCSSAARRIYTDIRSKRTKVS
jgi:hypothetical protein